MNFRIEEWYRKGNNDEQQTRERWREREREIGRCEGSKTEKVREEKY